LLFVVLRVQKFVFVELHSFAVDPSLLSSLLLSHTLLTQTENKSCQGNGLLSTVARHVN
jgi:hypothetical protein